MSPYVVKLAALMAVFSVFIVVPGAFFRAGRWISPVTGLVFIELELKLATEKMHA